MMSVLQLQAQVFKDDERSTTFGQAVERLSAYSNDELINACSSAYQTHISVLRPQIIVQGEQEYLQGDGVPEKVRTMLLLNQV